MIYCLILLMIFLESKIISFSIIKKQVDIGEVINKRKTLFLLALVTEILFLGFYFPYNTFRNYTFDLVFSHFKNFDILYFLKWFVVLFCSLKISQIIFLIVFIILGVKNNYFSYAEYNITKKGFFKGLAFYTFCTFLIFITIWLQNRFPTNNIDVCYNTIKNSNKGVDKTIILEFLANVLYSLVFATIISFCFARFLKVKILFMNKISIKIHKVISFMFLIFAITFFWFSLRVHEYIVLEVKNRNYYNKQVDSKFYKQHYKANADQVIFPKEKRNLILIIMESMESSYQDIENNGLCDINLIPNLSSLVKENINFSENSNVGGGYDATGTGWTVAALTAKLSGLPFNMPITANTNGLTQFLPNALTMTDYLSMAGYQQLFICGSDKKFASRDALLETHGKVEVHDINYYKEQGRLAQDYGVFWGFEDKKLYNFAKEDITELAKKNKPFSAMMLTVDTHMPIGYICESCELKHSAEEEELQMYDVINCADRMVFDFVEWCSKQEWYSNTNIVIVGDHLFMDADDTNFFTIKNEDFKRRWIDIFINVPESLKTNLNQKNRLFNSYDMFPTILASLNCEIVDDRLGFGTNLFSEKKTLAEEYGIAKLNEETMVPCKQYVKLMGTINIEK